MPPLEGSLTTCGTLFITRTDIQYAITFAPGTTADSDARPVAQVSVLDRSGGGSAAGQVVGVDAVTLGSTAHAVESAYPGGKWLTSAFQPGPYRIYVVDEGSAPITFGLNGDAVTDIVEGRPVRVLRLSRTGTGPIRGAA